MFLMGIEMSTGDFWGKLPIRIYIIKLGSGEDVIVNHENVLPNRCRELIGRKASRFDDYFIALLSGRISF